MERSAKWEKTQRLGLRKWWRLRKKREQALLDLTEEIRKKAEDEIEWAQKVADMNADLRIQRIAAEKAAAEERQAIRDAEVERTKDLLEAIRVSRANAREQEAQDILAAAKKANAIRDAALQEAADLEKAHKEKVAGLILQATRDREQVNAAHYARSLQEQANFLAAEVAAEASAAAKRTAIRSRAASSSLQQRGRHC